MIQSLPQKPITIVLDIGALHTSVGYAGESAPKLFTYSYSAFDTTLKSKEIKYFAGNNILKADRNDI